jgi:AcrR family transcriptional regulator
LSIHSHKSRPKTFRAVQAPQRANGRLRVAAILEAAAAVIAEQGYEAATMAEIASRSGTQIGSLYRFFPNKESLADTIVVSARENVDTVFDQFDAGVPALSIPALADGLLVLLLDFFGRLASMRLLEAGRDWSVKREEFRSALLRRIAGTFMIYNPKLAKKCAGDMAVVILVNTKAVATQLKMPDSPPRVLDEFRDMTRLYLQNRLGASSRRSRASKRKRSERI